VAHGVSYTQAIQSAPLQDEIFTELPSKNSVDGKPVQPTFIQPDLRAEAHKYIRDSDLELLASKVGLSSSTLANHLSYNSPKTATEYTGEQGTTEISVNIKRRLADIAINAMLADVCAYYGYEACVTHSWNRAGVNTPSENRALLEEYQSGVLPLDEYLKKRYSDLDNDAIAQWVAKIESKQQQELGGGLLNNKDYFNDQS
jgi:hypothetical protein